MIIKYFLIICIFMLTLLIGNAISLKYKERVIELKDFKSALNLLKAKIKYSYEPIPVIFSEISEKFKSSTIGDVFKNSKAKMKDLSAGLAWEIAIDEYKFFNVTKEDKQVLKGLGKLLGKTGKEGQICEIDLTENFLDMQIVKAEEERTKNEKLYKILGGIVGSALVVILI